MFKTTTKYAMIGLLSMGIAAGCANNSATTYAPGQAQQAQTVRLGTVVSVASVNIQEEHKLATLAGAALGGLAGSNLGKGSGRYAGAVVGALAGGYATDAATKAMGGQNGYEITVELDNKSVISVVQKADVAIAPGQRVRVVTGNGVTRVMPQ